MLRLPTVKERKRSLREIIRSALDVKGWLANFPSVEAARPSHCPACKIAARPVGGGLAVHGHGKRERQVWGPTEVNATPSIQSVFVRRYKCTCCGAVITVAPAELLTKRLYSAAAIIWAMALFAFLQCSPRAVRDKVSPFKHRGAASAARWLTLQRWCEAANEGRLLACVKPTRECNARRVAQRVASLVASYALPQPEPPTQCALSFLGAAHAR